MVVGFTTTYAISAYHHWCCEFESSSGRGLKPYMIKIVSDFWQVGGFLRVLPIKLTAMITEILLKVALNTIKQSIYRLYESGDPPPPLFWPKSRNRFFLIASQFWKLDPTPPPTFGPHLFFNLFNLFWHTDKNFCFYAEVNFWDFVRNDNSNKGTTARLNETRFGPKNKSAPIYLCPKNPTLFDALDEREIAR